MILSKEQILAAADLPRELVDVPEWGGQVYVSTMTGTQRDVWEEELIAAKSPDRKANLANLRARLAAMTLVDEQGAALFTPADVEALGRKSARALDRVFTVALRLNRLGKNDVEELAGN